MNNRVMFITESSGYGGAEKYLIYLAAGELRNAEVALALPFKDCNLKFRGMLLEMGVTVIDIPQFMAIYPVNLLIAVLFFFRQKTALFHFSLPYPDSCRWLLTAAALLRKNYIITEHLVPPDPFKAGAYFAVTHLLFNRLKRFSYDRAQQIIAVSKGNRDVLVKNYWMPADKMIVIHNGIDCSGFAPDAEANEALRNELEIPTDALVLTNIGRLAEQKGQRYLLTALELLAKERYQPVLLLAGDGPLMEQLQRQAKELRVENQVRFLGFRSDIARILKTTDIFVMPSLNEGFSLTLLEAMAAGKAIVATRVTGTTEAIIHQENGLLCTPASPQDLADKILMLINDSARRHVLGERARQTALAQFDVSIMVSKTLSHYDKGSTCAGR